MKSLYLEEIEGLLVEEQEAAQDFESYLKNSNLDKPLFLVEGEEPVQFHWANWDKTCQFQKEFSQKTNFHRERLKKLSNILGVMKSVDVWVRSRGTELKISLYDLYDSYLDNRIRLTWFDRDGETLVSIYNRSGPYITLKSMRWFNKEIYSLFVFRKILTHPMPHRSFRIGVNIPVKIQYEHSSLNEDVINLHQLTERGMIFKISGQNNLYKLQNCEKIGLSFDFTPFVTTFKAHYKETISELRKHCYDQSRETQFSLSGDVIHNYGNYENIRASNAANEFFLFCKYEDLKNDEEVESTTELQTSMSKFVTKLRQGLEKELKKIA